MVDGPYRRVDEVAMNWWITFGPLLLISPLVVLLVSSGVRDGWVQYWTGGDEGPW